MRRREYGEEGASSDSMGPVGYLDTYLKLDNASRRRFEVEVEYGLVVTV